MIDNLSKPDINFNFQQKIFVKEKVISDEIIEDIINFGKANVRPSINKYPQLFNVSFDACLLPLNSAVHTALEDVWIEAIDFFKFDISFVEPYELKRYTADAFFEKHIDNYYGLSIDMDRKITLSLQLSEVDEYEGGQFSVLGFKHKLPKGSIIAFPSFFPHEIQKIISGTRWSLISWAWGPYWR